MKRCLHRSFSMMMMILCQTVREEEEVDMKTSLTHHSLLLQVSGRLKHELPWQPSQGTDLSSLNIPLQPQSFLWNVLETMKPKT